MIKDDIIYLEIGIVKKIYDTMKNNKKKNIFCFVEDGEIKGFTFDEPKPGKLQLIDYCDENKFSNLTRTIIKACSKEWYKYYYRGN